jgi:cytochrome c oxidase cbb3-type subunit 3
VRALLLAMLLAPMAVFACWREERVFRATSAGPPAGAVRLSPLSPGPPSANPRVAHPYLANAYALNQGKKLYGWYNCVGCHAHGGGGMGPPLMDAKWIYGHDPDEIYASIAEGRPNGMPSFGGRIPPDQIWQIAAYVLSMSGGARLDAAPGRGDELQVNRPELLRRSPAPKGEPGGTP